MSEEAKPKYKVGNDIYTVLDYPLSLSRVGRDFSALVNVNYGIVKARIMSVVSSETASMKNEVDIVRSLNYVVVPTDKNGNPIPNMQNPGEPLMMKLGEADIFESSQEAKVAFLKVANDAFENFKKRVNDSAIEAASATIVLAKE